MAHLVVLDAFLKQKEGLTAEEIELIVEEVVSKYPSLTFADIHVIFRDAKLGKYGELYNRLTCANVVKWFDNYFAKRCETAYQMNLNADRQKYGATQGKSGDEVLQSLGYSVNKDGNIVLDSKKVEAKNALQEKERNRKEQEQQAKIDKDNEYMKWRVEYEKNGTL